MARSITWDHNLVVTIWSEPGAPWPPSWRSAYTGAPQRHPGPGAHAGVEPELFVVALEPGQALVLAVRRALGGAGPDLAVAAASRPRATGGGALSPSPWTGNEQLTIVGR